MAQASTKTAIANLAADLMKVDPVQSIEPPDAGSKFAKLAARWYDDTLREVLADHIWNHAIARVQVAAHPTAPAFGYDAKYELPADFIRIATIGDENNPETEYEIEDGFILCNVTSPINLRYVYHHTDISKFPPKFVQCLARKLKANCTYGMTGKLDMQINAEAEYKDYLSTGMTIDGQDNPPQRIRRSKWKAAKEGRSDPYTNGRVVI